MPLDPIPSVLVFVVLPVWFAAGIADWLCHRMTGIERTVGPREPVLHLVMLGQVGLALVTVMLAEINALVLGLLIALFVTHEATALWDSSLAHGRREVSPVEQHVHSFLEILPPMALLMLATLHWPQALALFGAGEEPARWTLGWKPEPLPARFVVGVVLAGLLLEVLPFAEELWRCLRARRRSWHGTDRAACSDRPDGARHPAKPS